MVENQEETESNIKPVQMYKTEDGSVFENKDDAVKHQQYIDFWQEITTLVEDSNMICNYDNTKDTIIRFIFENKKKLLDIIYDYPLAENMNGDDNYY